MSAILLLPLTFISLCFVNVRPSETSRSLDESGNVADSKQPILSMPLSGGWGLPDSVAVVGKLFYYQLPTQDGTSGNYTNYQVTAVGEEDGRLQPWLTFNKVSFALEGVPDEDALGRIQNIQVTADYIRSTDGSLAPIKEFFTIKVLGKDDTVSSSVDGFKPLKILSSANGLKSVMCRRDVSVTTASVIIDVDGGTLPGSARVSLLRNLCSHLGLPESLVRLVPLQDRPLFDDSTLVAGPGDTKHPTSGGVMVQWDVGCGNVYADHMPVLELLEVTSNNGTMGKKLGYGIVGWHVTSQRLIPRRLKRQIHFAVNPTSTLLPSVVRPTGRPVPTITVTDTDVPESRIVPTTTSAVHPGITKTQPPIMSTRPPQPETSEIRPSKSPTPTATTTTYVITATQVLSTVTSTVTIPVSIINDTTQFFTVDEVEPSISTEPEGRFHSTEALPSWTTKFPTLTEPTSSKLSTPRGTKRPPKTPRPTPESNMAPNVSRPLDIIEVVVGNTLLFPIPDETFTDDGGSANLKILFLLANDNTVEPVSWIKFNETSRTLYGFPLEEHIGMHHYLLAAVDSHGKLAKTPCNISVKPLLESQKINHELSVTLDLEYQAVMYDLATRMNLINKIAAAFGDKDASKITITKISAGSVVISWTNNTLPLDPCPEKEIEALLRYLLQPNGEINETFAKAMEPYRVLKAEGKSLGSCSPFTDSTTSSTVEASTTIAKALPTSTSVNEVDVKPRVQQSDNLLLYILLPVLLFLFLLLLLIIVCVVCYKRQRKRQKEQDKLNGLHKGIPIIFADELDDKQDTPTSTLKSRSPEDEEKRSVPPPEYPSSKPGSKSSTLRSDYKSPLISDNENDDDDRDGPAPATLPRHGHPSSQSAASAAAETEATTTTPLLHFNA